MIGLIGGLAAVRRASAGSADLDGGQTAPRAQTRSGGVRGAARFPVAVSEDRRYLRDAGGRPFMMVGDSAWSMIAELTDEEADIYLDQRRRQGFNTLLVNLIEHEFSSNAPANARGVLPFRQAGDFSAPNDRYFDDAEKLLLKARERGFLVLLVPAYLGAGGGGQGWYVEMLKAGPEALRAYGRYVGRRYRELENIIWVHGGDYDDPDKSLARAVAEGIAEADPRALQTVHSSRDTVTADYWRGERWLSLDTVYTYGDVFEAVGREFGRRPGMPILMIEALYEAEHGTDAQRVRAQAYGAMLAGSAGQIYGNNPVWHFSGPGLFGTLFGWRHALASDGASSIGHLGEFLAPLEWWKIEPDRGAVLLDAKARSAGHYAICGAAADGSFAIVYTSDTRELTLRSPWGRSQYTAARWYDPANGTFHDAAYSAADQNGSIAFPVPRQRNAGGFEDWVLLVMTAR